MRIDGWITRNKLQWNLIQNAMIFVEEFKIKNVVCKMAAILKQSYCVILGLRLANQRRPYFVTTSLIGWV